MSEHAAPDHSFLGFSDRRWALFASIVTVIGIGSVMATRAWAIFEYRQELEARRIQYTLSVIDSWEEHGYRLAYGNLRQAHARFTDSIPRSELDVAAESDIARANLARNFVRVIEADAELAEDVREVVYFFNRLAICLDAGVCSFATSSRFFDDTVRTFLGVYRPYIERHKADFPGGAQTVFDLSPMLNASVD